MNSRERLLAAARGGEVDRRPVICWPEPCPDSDAIFQEGPDDKIRLAPVLNPFGQALKAHIDIGDALAEEPRHGEKLLHGLISKTKAEIQKGFDSGADGVLYLLFGARGIHTTPMEYGGHFLEQDRELLHDIQDATFNMIFVVGEDDAYLDFVSDLPAHAFAWDRAATGTSAKQMRQMRSGALATNDLDADIDLRFGVESVSSDLELRLQECHV